VSDDEDLAQHKARVSGEVEETGIPLSAKRLCFSRQDRRYDNWRTLSGAVPGQYAQFLQSSPDPENLTAFLHFADQDLMVAVDIDARNNILPAPALPRSDPDLLELDRRDPLQGCLQSLDCLSFQVPLHARPPFIGNRESFAFDERVNQSATEKAGRAAS